MSATVPNGEFVDYYKLLGLDTDAGLQQLRSAYLRMAKICHPDAGGSTEQMQLLNTAYKTLARSTSRAAYDMLHNFHTGSKPVSHYKEDGTPQYGNSQKMSDEYIDYFLDAVYSEFHKETKPVSIKEKIQKLFRLKV